MIPTYLECYHTTKELTTPTPSTSSPKSGPLIPGSNPPAFYTLAQAHIGGIRSGATRRFRVRNLHAKVRAMDRKGKTQTQIANLLGYNQSTVSRILSGIIRSCLNLRESLKNTARKATLAIRQRKAAAKLAAKEAMREQSEYSKRVKPVAKKSRFGKVNAARNHALRYFYWNKGQEKKRAEAQAAARERDKDVPVKTCLGCGFQKHLDRQPCPMCGRVDLIYVQRWREGGYAESE